jgi:inorganic pyrophosphatase
MISDFIGEVYNKACHRDSSDDEGQEMDEKEKMTVPVTIEIPKGSRNKVEVEVDFDKDKRLLKFDRMLFSAVHYPNDDGFISDTLAENGDALDALVSVWEPTFPGCVIEAKPVGFSKRWNERGADEKILCVPISDPFWNDIESLSGVPPHWLQETEPFSKNYKELEKKQTGVEGWENRESAIKPVTQSQQKCQKEQMKCRKI